MRSRCLALLLGTIGAVSCARVPVIAAVTFRNSWTVDGETVTPREQALVRATVFDALREAYRGFAVTFVDADTGPWIVRIEDTPYADPHVIAFGAAGLTFPGSRISSVRADVLFDAALASIPCDHITGCGRSTSYAHFFGTLHWSDQARRAMSRTLPPEP